MAANQKPLNQIGIFWYQFTPRKLLYLIIYVNLSNLVHIGCPVFWATLYITIMVKLPIFFSRQISQNIDGFRQNNAPGFYNS